MIQALGLEGAVYVLENAEAQRVKVGMTAIGVNDVGDRRRDINDKCEAERSPARSADAAV